MIDALIEMFSYRFMVRAGVVGLLVSLCAALLGVCLVLKRYSMIGDGLSHVGFGALAVASALGLAPMTVAVPVVVIAAFLLLRLSGRGKLKGDAMIAMISTAALAVGVIALSLSNGTTGDVNNYLFGSVLAMSDSDLKLSVVLGMRVMGAMRISSLIVFPGLTAMRVFKSFRKVLLCALAVSMVCFFAGLCASFALSIPTGASVVAANVLAFLLFSGLGRLRREK